MSEVRARGGCLCGGVRYEVTGPLRGVWACHCSQCRRTSGNFVAATQCRRDDLVLLSTEPLAWYRSSPAAERGFCTRCGGNLFWRPDGRDVISIMAGTLEPPTGLSIERQMHADDKSDYYGLSVDLGHPPAA